LLSHGRYSWQKKFMESGFAATLLSIAVIASFILGAGGMWLIVKGRDRKRGLLMLAAAAVTVGNVLIWMLPLTQR
jgi:peptidoglycan biosynthesis protein MviN/MurJ (putative lipid II flippase)